MTWHVSITQLSFIYMCDIIWPSAPFKSCYLARNLKQVARACTKLFRKTKEIGDNFFLQDDIDKLVKWSEKWQMLFNFGKCKCLHTGPGNTGMNYEMGVTILSKTVKKKDLGVTMNANMKVSEQ